MAASINISVYSDALVVLGTAGVVVPLVQRWGISPVLGYLGAGALLGPLGLGSFIGAVPLLYWVTVVDAKNVASIADLGVVFLLFLIGLELSYERLMAMRRLVFGLGGLQVLLTTCLLTLMLTAAGLKPAIALMIGGCLALSSTAIVLEVLSGQGRLTSSAGWSIQSRAAVDEIVAAARGVRPDVLIVSRARDAAHARHLYGIGVTDAVPETVEASLQLSEAALVGLGVATGPVIASIHEKRDEFRRELQTAAGQAGRSAVHSIRARSKS